MHVFGLYILIKTLVSLRFIIALVLLKLENIR
jgi:hypothetical protein